MPKQRKLIKYICRDCGAEFEAVSNRAFRCEKCRKEVAKLTSRNWYRENKSRKIPRTMPPRKSIRQVLRELERYNKEHGTFLSYGQYIAMIEKGEF